MAKIEIILEEGRTHHFFTTKEKCTKCPKCDKTFSRKKWCPDCSKGKKKKTLTKPHTKEHQGKLSKDLKMYGCDCVFGSWWRWAKHWRINKPKTRCKHCNWSTKKIIKEKLYKPLNIPCKHCNNRIDNIKIASEGCIKLLCGKCSKTFRITKDKDYYLNHRDEKTKIEERIE